MTKIYPPTEFAYRKININRCWMKEDYIERVLCASFISLLYYYVTETYTQRERCHRHKNCFIWVRFWSCVFSITFTKEITPKKGGGFAIQTTRNYRAELDAVEGGSRINSCNCILWLRHAVVIVNTLLLLYTHRHYY